MFTKVSPDGDVMPSLTRPSSRRSAPPEELRLAAADLTPATEVPAMAPLESRA